ncbi:hypothetical protein [Devosia sp. DBB001]|nr:hypothetical protein [Devosia sp. DBB001]
MEIEVFLTILRVQSHALASLKGETGPGVGAVQRRHECSPIPKLLEGRSRPNKNQKRAASGRRVARSR